MKLSALDYGLVVVSAKLAPRLSQLGQLETDWRGARPPGLHGRLQR